jgi:hypothetical protein
MELPAVDNMIYIDPDITSWAMIIIQEMMEFTTRQPNSVLNVVESTPSLSPKYNKKDC